MDHTYILPFVKSIKNVFSTMLQIEVQVGKPTLKSPDQPSFDVSGIIGMSGDIEGSVVLSFSRTGAEAMVQRFTGMDMTASHEDFADAIGELVNMVSGSAKAEISGKKINISCPSVVIGAEHTVYGAKDVTCLIIPCDSELGVFALEVWVKTISAKTQEAQPAQAAS